MFYVLRFYKKRKRKHTFYDFVYVKLFYVFYVYVYVYVFLIFYVFILRFGFYVFFTFFMFTFAFTFFNFFTFFVNVKKNVNVKSIFVILRLRFFYENVKKM